jgi:hypothetical protein
MNKKIAKFLLWMSFLLFFTNCKLFSDENQIPYLISGDIELSESDSYCLDYKFYNNSGKNVYAFTLVLFVYDEDGNPPPYCSSNFVINVASVVSSYSYSEDKIDLKPYIVEVNEVYYNIDYIYISNIVYEDGSVWSDPLGFSIQF